MSTESGFFRNLALFWRDETTIATLATSHSDKPNATKRRGNLSKVPAFRRNAIYGPLSISAALLLICVSGPVVASTFSVTNTGDTGAGSLRQAITDANNHVGADTITFNISGAGVHTITPLSALPAISDPVMIDGYTQPGSSANSHGPGVGDNSVHLIEIDGTNTGGGNGSGVIILNSTASGSTIRGLVVNRGPSSGIVVLGASNVTIKGCFAGMDPTGSIPHGNGDCGILLDNNATMATIGGLTPDARNLLSGNGIAGLGFGNDGGAGGSGHHVQGNFIGTNAAGTNAPIQNQGGVSMAYGVSNSTVGGTTPSARNIISGNFGRGVILSNGIGNPAVTNNIIAGNFIGADLTGTQSMGNGNYPGIGLYAPGNTIGGTGTGAGNVIAGNNTAGIDIQAADGSLIEGNFIGTDLTGTLNLGNRYPGITIAGSNVTVGGTSAGAGNVIAFNGINFPRGILIYSGTGNAILGNSIFSNGGIGIDLNADGVTLNDAGDVDTGPNNFQNFPVLTSVTSRSGMATRQ